MKTQYQLTPQQYSQIYECDVQSIRRYMKAGVPLDAPPYALQHLGAQRTAPQGTIAKGLERIVADFIAIARPEAGSTPPPPSLFLENLCDAHVGLGLVLRRNHPTVAAKLETALGAVLGAIIAIETEFEAEGLLEPINEE